MKAKRMAALALTLLVLWAGLPRAARAASYRTDVRVLLSIGSPTSFTFTPVGSFTLLEAPELTVGEQELTVTVEGSRPSITIGDTTVTAPSLTFVNGDYEGRGNYIRLRNKEHGTCTYLGNLTFDVRGGKLRAINTLPVELYLYGVVPHEMSNSFPLEALKAQAVCARSYAIAQCSRHAGRSYDLVDTSDDQVYEGYASRNTRAIAAVNATAGQVLAYEGDIIEAFYTSSNGGQTERSGNVWSEDHPYYINQDDPYDLANASSMEYTAFIPAVFNGETVAMMETNLYSTLLRLAYEAAGEPVALVSTVNVAPAGALYDAPARSYGMADVTLEVRKGDGTVGQVTVSLVLNTLVFDEALNTLGQLGARNYTLRMRGVEPARLSRGGVSYFGWNLTMRRYGHGVGLSQRGAQERARSGYGYSDILSFYYVGAVATKSGTWETAPRITSDSYRIDATGVYGVTPGTVPKDILSKLNCEGATLTVVTSKGALKVESELTTGNFIRAAYESADGMPCVYDLPVIIYGDLDGEGGLTRADVEALAQHLARTAIFTGTFLEAADVNRDGVVDAQDLVLLIRALNGDAAITQG